LIWVGLSHVGSAASGFVASWLSVSVVLDSCILWLASLFIVEMWVPMS